jgi:hypothetical protein
MIDFIAVMCIRMVRSLRDENAADEDVGETRHAAKRPRVMSRESASPDGLQHGRFSGTGSSALRPAAVDRPMASAAFWISAEAWPQPVCVVDGDALADTGLLSHASYLLKAYSRADGLEDEKLIQTDLEEDKTVLDAIAAVGQWHADRPPFSSLGELQMTVRSTEFLNAEEVLCIDSCVPHHQDSWQLKGKWWRAAQGKS